MENQETQKAKRRQIMGMFTLAVLYCALIVAGILLAVAGVHCRADRPVYAVCAVLSTGMVSVCMVHEARLWKFLKQEDREGAGHGKEKHRK